MNSVTRIVISLFSILEYFEMVLIKEEYIGKVELILQSYGISAKKMYQQKCFKDLHTHGVRTTFSNSKGSSIFHEGMNNEEG